MNAIGTALIIASIIISFYYGLILMITAFEAGILWGLGYLFIPLVSVIFVILHWEDAKSPFLKGLLALPLAIAGLILTKGNT